MIGRLWRDHSLSIVLLSFGAFLVLAAFQHEPGTKWWDVLLGFGTGVLTVALFYVAAGFFREKNKPEDPP